MAPAGSEEKVIKKLQSIGSLTADSPELRSAQQAASLASPQEESKE